MYSVREKTLLLAPPKILELVDPQVKLKTILAFAGTRDDLAKVPFYPGKDYLSNSYVLGISVSGRRRIIMDISESSASGHSQRDYSLWLSIDGDHIHGIYRHFHSHETEDFPHTVCSCVAEDGYICVRGLHPSALFVQAYYVMQDQGKLEDQLYQQGMMPDDQRSFNAVRDNLFYNQRVPIFDLKQLPGRLNYKIAVKGVVNWFYAMATDPMLFDEAIPDVTPMLKLAAINL